MIDRDDSELSRSVAAFLAEQGPSVGVADEARACQDAVATGEVDYLLIVPAGFQEDYLAAAEMIKSGKIDADKIVTHKFKIDEFQKAYEVCVSGAGLKVVIEP